MKRKKLLWLLIPLTVALILGLFPWGRGMVEVVGDRFLSVGIHEVYAAGWVSPTGFNDPGGKWSDETYTYDEDTATYASLATKQNYLELTLAAAISCDKIQIWCSFRAGDDWYVDVYYGAAWHNIHIGALTDDNWTEIAVGSTQSIDKARFTNWDVNDGRINEFDFWEVEACSPDISNTPAIWSVGVVATSTDYWSDGSAPSWPLDDGECHFTVSNNSGGAVSITVKATNFTGGVGWTLTSGSPGEDTVRLRSGKSGDANEAAMVVLTTSEQSFISGLADSATKKWELKMETPTSYTDGAEKTSTVTLTATCD